MLYSPLRSLSHLSASLIDTSLNDRVTRCPKAAVAMHKHATR